MVERMVYYPDQSSLSIHTDLLPRGVSMDRVEFRRSVSDFSLPGRSEHRSLHDLRARAKATFEVAQNVMSTCFDSLMDGRGARIRVEPQIISRRFGGDTPVYHYQKSSPEGQLLFTFSSPLKGSLHQRIISLEQLPASPHIVEPRYESMDVALGTISAARFQVARHTTEDGFVDWKFKFLKNQAPSSQEPNTVLTGQDAIDSFLNLTLPNGIPVVNLTAPHIVYRAQQPR